MSEYRMIDVGEKPVTAREAVAVGTITLSSKVLDRIRERTIPKGDVLGLAEVAGILGVKSTPQILPLCHPLPIEGVKVACEPDYERGLVSVTCSVRTHGKTGVEMEALSGVSAALLCIYDLTKAIDKGAEIGSIRLLEKRGGKSGHYRAGSEDGVRGPLEGLRVGVLTVSDRASEGGYEDRSGPVAREFFSTRGAAVVCTSIVPDERERIRDKVSGMIKADEPNVIIVTGGTGVSPRDVTPEAISALWTRRIPGIGELLRSNGALHTPHSWLSRSEAGFIHETLVVLLPGSPKAVDEGLHAIERILGHTIRIAKGVTHD